MTKPGTKSSIYQKLVMLGLLVVALWMLSNDHFSVLEALNRHEPSARIFRSLLELNILLFGAAFSLYIWSRTIGVDCVEQLFFPPDPHASGGGYYNSLQQQPDDDDGDQEQLVAPESATSSSVLDFDRDETGAHARYYDHRTNDDTFCDADADYESDGEVQQPSSPLHFMMKHHSSTSDPITTMMSLDKNNSITKTCTPVPSAISVFGTALDTLLLILVALFLFSLSASGLKSKRDNPNQPQTWIQLVSRIAAPTFPLLLFVYLMSSIVFTTKARPFWKVLSYTIAAPFYEVTFRDGFVGDVLTSSVRPLQDVTFTTAYILYGLQGWWSQSYYDVDSDGAVANDNNSNTASLVLVQDDFVSSTTTATSQPAHQFHTIEQAVLPAMEKSWLLHTILLPLCVVGPLWWRYLQNLRQTADFKQRWPYLGNAFKYFCAAQVAVFGMFFPELQSSPYWLAAFCGATLYQTWWDVFMDWGLLEQKQGTTGTTTWQLRKERLYPNACMYWTIAGINFVLRFCWTLSFIPPNYLNPSGFLVKQNTLLVSPIIASAEIIRRTLWGLLRFEYEVIKVNKTLPKVDLSSEVDAGLSTFHDTIELTSIREGKDEDISNQGSVIHDMLDLDTQLVPSAVSDMSSMNDIQILGELCMYGATFVALCLVGVAHRATF